MRSFISTAAVALAATTFVSAAPAPSSHFDIIQLPLGDGFPTPSAQQLKEIEDAAFGTLSNGAPPPSLNPDTLTSIRLVAFNENFESFFFANFLKQLDNPYFLRTLGELNTDLDTLKATIGSILPVEELHSVNANNALQKVGKVDPILPCKYKFPVDDVKSAVVLANRFTDVVMGTLQDVVFKAATVGDAGFTPGVVAAAEDEGEQNGGFRLFLRQTRPQSQPFNTRAVRDFAFSILQDFVVPGSCPNENEIDLEVFQPLTASDPSAKDQDITFTFSLKPTRNVPKGGKTPDISDFASKYNKNDGWKALTITYLDGQNINTEPLKSFKLKGDTVTVTADFPQSANDIFGGVIATLTVGDNFASPEDVKDATLFGPAPLEVQESGVPSY